MGIEKLQNRVEIEWDTILASMYQKVIENMSRRVVDVLKTKEGYSKY